MSQQLKIPLVLDACCGPRMFWFDGADRRALFIDKRQETHAMDLGTAKTRGQKPISVAPDIRASFTALPFADESFFLVVFDPPHMSHRRAGRGGVFSRKYGTLTDDWPAELKAGFAECFRVLKANGTMIFKWADTSIPVSQVLLAALPRTPLFGNRTGRHTHWIVFIKDNLTR